MASRLEGVDVLMRRLEALKRLDDGRAIRAAVTAGIKPARERAKGLIPVGVDAHRTYKGRLVAPGFAQRSIGTRTRLSKDKQKATASLGVAREAFYAVNFVEIGTAKMPARPWLRPALESTQSQAEGAIADSLRRTVKRASKA